MRTLVFAPGRGAPAGQGQELAESDRAAVCSQVAALLAEHGDARITVRLSCGWCRLLLLPWNAQLTRAERWRNFAQARFEQVYGESAAAWPMVVATDAPGRDRLAVAWPADLRDLFAAQRNVSAVRVALLEHLDALLRVEPEFSGCVVEIDGDGAGFVLLRNGLPRRVRWSRFDDNEGLAAALRSEWAGVLAADAAIPRGEPGLALTPPEPQAGSPRGATVAALVSALGFSRAFALPGLP